jgi:Putative zinc-finger
MNKNCTQIEETLSDYLEGSLPSEIAAAFAAHLDTCGDCSQLVTQVRDLTRGMRELDPMAEPPFLANKIITATIGSRGSRWPTWLSWPSLIWQPQFAMGAVTVAASLLILLHATAGGAGNVTLTDVSPASVARVANRRAHLAYAHGVRFVNDLRLVYDIESLLASPEPANAPANPEQPAPSLDPRQKSKAMPGGNDKIEARQTPGADLEASLSLPANFYRSAP